MYQLDPVNAAFAARIAGLPSPHEAGNYQQAFDNLEELQKHKPAEDIQTETLEVGYGPTTVALVRSKSLVNKSLPMVFYTHGGGYILGSAKSFALLLEDLARRTGAAIVFPVYTRVPHQTFPYQFHQSYEVLEYIVQHASQHQLLAQTIALAGDSPGVVLSTPACTCYLGFVANRFFIGLIEAGLSPLFMLVTSKWYTNKEQVQRMGFWYSSGGAVNLVSLLTNYGLGSIKGSIAGWRILHILAGALTLLWSRDGEHGPPHFPSP